MTTIPTPIVHTSIQAARMFYALRRDGCSRDAAFELAGIYHNNGCNLRGLMAVLRRSAA